MFTNRIIAGLFSAATVFAATAAHAQNLSAQDKTFMTTLSHGNNAEIAAGKIAVRKSNDKEVRAVAQTIIAEHSKNEATLLTLGKKFGVTLPTEPTATQKASAKKLAAKSGSAFDKAYLADQIKAHHATIALLQKEIATSKNSDVRDYATQTLGAVMAHTDTLHKAEGTSTNKMMSKMGGMKTGMVNPATKVNAQIARLSGVENKSLATPKPMSGTFDAQTTPAKPQSPNYPVPGLD